MSWSSFLEALCQRQEYGLTPLEVEVIMCLQEAQGQSKNDLLEAYINSYSMIEEEAFTQRLKNIYKKFHISSRGHKLPQLHKYLSTQYLQYQNDNLFFSKVGLNYIHPSFPRDGFSAAIKYLTNLPDADQYQVDILQTFAPNLDDYYGHLIECIQAGVKIRILLAWPYSEAARLREEVLRRYANSSFGDETNIRDCVIANLETLEKIIRYAKNSHLLMIKLYDTLPSLAIYRAGNYMLAAPFLHGALAINTFQIELNLSAENQFVAHTLQNDFELMWQVSRYFSPDPHRNWRNDLRILFAR